MTHYLVHAPLSQDYVEPTAESLADTYRAVSGQAAPEPFPAAEARKWVLFNKEAIGAHVSQKGSAEHTIVYDDAAAKITEQVAKDHFDRIFCR